MTACTRDWTGKCVLGAGHLGGCQYERMPNTEAARLRSLLASASTPEETGPELNAARLAYANACERMGMAHASGTRREWEEATVEESRTRGALMAAIGSSVEAARREGAAALAAAERRAEDAESRAASLSEALRGLYEANLTAAETFRPGIDRRLAVALDAARSALAPAASPTPTPSSNDGE